MLKGDWKAFVSRRRNQGMDRAGQESWPLPPERSGTDLEHCLFDRACHNTQRIEAQPDWAYIHHELCCKGVTLSLLWEEYRADHPQGYGYSRFCELLWLPPVMQEVFDRIGV